MARHYGHPLFGVPYCGDNHTSKREVHDLDQETSECRINEIVAAGRAVAFQTLAEARAAGYGECAYCIGGRGRER